VVMRIMEVEGLTDKIFIVADREPISFYELVDIIHTYYYKNAYPEHRRLPSFVYQLAATLFRMMGNDKWEAGRPGSARTGTTTYRIHAGH